MSFFRRLSKIIKSNINYEGDIDINDEYNKILFNDILEDLKKQDKINPVEKEYYSILHIENGSNFEEIKQSYKNLLKQNHPDLYDKNSAEYIIAQEKVKKINEAYYYFKQKFKNKV